MNLFHTRLTATHQLCELIISHNHQ